MNVKIYCDMDGVLCDFMGGAAREHGLSLDPYPCPGVWDFITHMGIDPATFYAPMGRAFWYNLAPTPDFIALTGRLAELADEGAEVYLLSSPCDTPGCRDGKQDWVNDHWPAMRSRLILTRAKEAIAGPGRILIDDSDANCLSWQKHGGTPVLFPRVWNALSHLADVGIDHVLAHHHLRLPHDRAHARTCAGLRAGDPGPAPAAV